MPTKEKKLVKLGKEAELDAFCEDAFEDPHTRVEFIRKKDRTKRGVMISCKHPTIIDHVIIGFSLCNLEYDFHEGDFGKGVAFFRAMKYSNLHSFIVNSIHLDNKHTDRVYIPQTVFDKLVPFVQAAYKYYKECSFPPWVVNAIPVPPPEEYDPSKDSSTSSLSDAD